MNDNSTNKQESICVLGMHRSGTSLVSGILSILGVYLGSRDALMKPSEANPKGFWEFNKFVEINDQILGHFGGNWHKIPYFPPDWQRMPELTHLKQDAKEALETTFGKTTQWGWKDPRNSITLPFWKSIIPSAKYIICFRNPLDVIQSLQKRDDFSFSYCEEIWAKYTASAILHTEDSQRLFVSYEEIMGDPEIEIRRLAKFINRTAQLEEKKTRDELKKFTDSSLQHHNSSFDSVVTTEDVSPITKLFFFHLQSYLQAQRGVENHLFDVQNVKKTLDSIAFFSTAILDMHKLVNSLHEDVGGKNREIQRLNQKLANMRSKLQSLIEDPYYIWMTRIKRGINTSTKVVTKIFIHLGNLLKINRTSASGTINEGVKEKADKAKKHPVKKVRLANETKEIQTSSDTPNNVPVRSKLPHRTKHSMKYVPFGEQGFNTQQATAKLIAFYQPQYYPTPENESWWGKGFTEWTNTSKALPQFEDHYQPHLPDDLGFYDLRVPDVLERQVKLASHYGIYGFCYRYYQNDGKPIFNLPILQHVSDLKTNFPFCLCWSNEKWTSRWKAEEQDIIFLQNFVAENEKTFIQNIKSIINHDQYIRVNNRPLLIIENISLFKDPANSMSSLREQCYQEDINDPYILILSSKPDVDLNVLGVDAVIYKPLISPEKSICHLEEVNPEFQGEVYRYSDAAADSILNAYEHTNDFQCLFPSWDSEPSRPGKGQVYLQTQPKHYQSWLESIGETITENNDGRNFIFIDAWNEWGMGAHLEPDQKLGYTYLQATANALKTISQSETKHKLKKNYDTAIIVHLYHTEMWDEIAGYLKNLDDQFDLYISIPKSIEYSTDKILEKYPNATIFRFENRGRDVGPFINIFSLLFPMGYKYICKIHTKKSPHRNDGDLWRRDLLNGLLGSREQINKVKGLLASDPSVGIIIPPHYIINIDSSWGENKDKIYMLAHKAGIPVRNFDFAAGSMFWFRPSAFNLLFLMKLAQNDFEVEQAQLDGTLAHALERFLGLLVQHHGYKIIGVSIDPN